MELSAIRAELPVLERYAYLNAGTNGPLPRRTGEAMAKALERDLREGRSSKGYFEAMLAGREQVREALAHVLNASAADIALANSTTQACNVVYRGLALGPGDEVVTTDSEHPGLFGGLAASGAVVHAVPVRELPVDQVLDALLAAVSSRTRLIAVSQISWLTGAVFPVRELAGHGVPLLVDGAQAAGAVPVDVQALGCDFYTLSAQKWLLGPDVTGGLYVRPEWVEELRLTFPSYGSWDSEAESEYTPKNSAARFDPGWIPLGSLTGLQESLAFADGAGPERFDRARETAARLRELLLERVEVVTEAGQGTLVTWKSDGDSGEAVLKLAEAGVVIRDLAKFGWLRASCGFWTSEDDLQRLLAAL
jgi:L-cysteine/cystine lyase